VIVKGKRPVQYIEYAWGLLVPIAGVFWNSLRGLQKQVGEHGEQLATITETAETLEEHVTEARVGRKEIFDKIELTRKEATRQHEQLRKEQRQDFAAIRKSIERLAG